MRIAYTLLALVAAIGAATPALAQEGACCLMPCYICIITTFEDCQQQGGMWIGDGTTCDPAP